MNAAPVTEPVYRSQISVALLVLGARAARAEQRRAELYRVLGVKSA